MAAEEPQQQSDRAASAKDRLPFEPAKKRQKPPKAKASVTKETKQAQPNRKLTNQEKEEIALPKVVSNRMARRMAAFAGIPTFLGVSTFFISYIVVSQGWFKLPPIAVLMVSMGCFGLGVLGISYGILSASWDEDRVGGIWGRQEFQTNWGRMVEAWRASRQKNV
jgi:hypothetical protein